MHGRSNSFEDKEEDYGWLPCEDILFPSKKFRYHRLIPQTTELEQIHNPSDCWDSES